VKDCSKDIVVSKPEDFDEDKSLKNFEKIYGAIIEAGTKELKKLLTEDKINGPTYAGMVDDLTKRAISSAIDFSTKESPADMAIKSAEIQLSKYKIELTKAQLCSACEDCNLKKAQIDEIRDNIKNNDLLTQSKIRLETETIEEIKDKIKNNDLLTKSKIALETATIEEIGKESIRKDTTTEDNTSLTESKISVDTASVNEMEKESTRKDTITEKDSKIKERQEELYRRQTEGFTDNLKTRMFEIQMNSWATMFSSGLLENIPTIINDQEASLLYSKISEQYDLDSTTLSRWDQHITATEISNGKTKVTWGKVTQATAYLLYARSENGEISGYPKSVNANGEETISINGADKLFTFKVVAFNDNKRVIRTTSTQIRTV